MAAFGQTSTDRLALTLTTEASVGLIETKKWADHFSERMSKDDINSAQGIAAATLALEDPESSNPTIECNPGETMEAIEAKMLEEKAEKEAEEARLAEDKAKKEAEELEALRKLSEAEKLELSNPLGMYVSKIGELVDGSGRVKL